MSFKDLALPLIARGIPVIPVDPESKRCTIPGWPTIATTDPNVVELLDRQYPNYNVGAVAKRDGLVILDCDVASLPQRIQADLGHSIAKTFAVLSAGRKCPHLYYWQTDRSRALGNRKAADLFDLKCHNSYVVGPGSTLTDGRTYDILQNFEIAPFPDELADWVEKHSQAPKDDAPREHRSVSADFDIFGFLDHYGLEAVQHGNWYVTNICPVAGHRHEQSGRTGFYYDGDSFGFNCFAGNCRGSNMTVGRVIEHLNAQPNITGHGTIAGKGPYTGVIWPEPKLEFKSEPVTGGDFDFVIEPGENSTDGWFPLGDTSLVAAASGNGKTTLMMDLLAAQVRGEDVFGHKTNKRPYIILLEDRGQRSLRRTMKRMRINLEDLPYKMLDREGKSVAIAIKDILESTTPQPQVVFLEGLDLAAEDAAKMQSVSKLLKELHMVADHFHVAIIGSVGCPKMKPKDQYTNLRDTVFGSSAWSRKVETIIALQREGGKETSEITTMTVMLRNARSEEFRLEFADGRLRIAPPEETVDERSQNLVKVETWIRSQARKVRVTEVEIGTGMSEKAVRKSLAKLVDEGNIKHEKVGITGLYWAENVEAK